ncbi:MAG: hypothetical protein ACLQDY_08460 [Streptosporangiaceae bacterium]
MIARRRQLERQEITATPTSTTGQHDDRQTGRIRLGSNVVSVKGH